MLRMVLLPLLAVAVAYDLRERRIPNGLVVIAIAIACVLSLATTLGFRVGESNAESIGGMFLGLTLGIAAGLVLFAIGAVGAGDGKLLGVIGAFLGPWGLVTTVLYAGVTGGLLALAGAARRQTLIPVLLRTRDLGLHLVTFGRVGERWTVDSPGAVSIPFAVPIAIGALLALVFPLLSGGAS